MTDTREEDRDGLGNTNFSNDNPSRKIAEGAGQSSKAVAATLAPPQVGGSLLPSASTVAVAHGHGPQEFTIAMEASSSPPPPPPPPLQLTPPPPPPAVPPAAPYSVFSKRKKQAVVLSASLCAVFSTLTANSYLPALHVLARDFDVSVSKINLTVTTYLIFQGITPMLLGAFADRMGRRPAYIICFVVYGSANIGLALAPNYSSLLGLRCLQAAGISGTQTLCQAVVADIITSAERGHYIGFVTLSAILGPSLGPIIGGALTDGLGWRSIFWFQTICAGVILVLLLLFYPETCRPLVGDGSVTPPEVNQTLLQLIKDERARRRGCEAPVPVALHADKVSDKTERAFPLKYLFTSLLLLWNKELALLLFYGGVLYSGINAISAALPTQFTEIYHLNSLEIGLIFLPMAVGSVIAVGIIGKLLNWNYRRHAAKLGLIVDKKMQIDLINFPIERARIELGLPLLLVTAAIVIAWGWALERHVSIAVPCVLSFLLGVFYIGVLNIFNTLITDLYRKKAGSAVAANWFIRCMLGAVMTAIIQPLILAVGSGWAYTIMGVAYVAFSPSLLIVMWKGLEWRQKEREKEERKKASKSAEKDEGDIGIVDQKIATEAADDKGASREKEQTETSAGR